MRSSICQKITGVIKVTKTKQGHNNKIDKVIKVTKNNRAMKLMGKSFGPLTNMYRKLDQTQWGHTIDKKQQGHTSDKISTGP